MEHEDNIDNIDSTTTNITPDEGKKPELSLKEKIQKATELKEKGNRYYKEKQFYDAITYYKEGLETLYGCGLSNEAREVMLTINNNMCYCLNQLGAYEQCIDRMNFSLKLRTDSPKIYYYRGIAYVNTGKFEEAEKDYDKLFELLPSKDAALANLRQLIDEKKPQRKEDTPNTNIYKCFLKANVYDEEKPQAKRKDSSSDDEKEPVDRVKIWD